MSDHEKPALVENMLLLRKEDFDELLNRAAERGAERCLDLPPASHTSLKLVKSVNH